MKPVDAEFGKCSHPETCQVCGPRIRAAAPVEAPEGPWRVVASSDDRAASPTALRDAAQAVVDECDIDTPPTIGAIERLRAALAHQEEGKS